MRFSKRNKIRWVQDHCTVYGETLPADVDFEVTPSIVGFNLKACGYGCLEHTNCYGNGSLFAWRLHHTQRKQLERAAR